MENRKYFYTLEVERAIMDTVTVAVDAGSEDVAREIAMDVAKTYPQAHTQQGVSHIYTENRNILESRVFDIERMVKKDG